MQDIIDRANVGRATFYTHFDNKQDLLVSGLDDLRASLKQRQREALARGTSVEERVFAFSQEMFAHANEHRNIFQAMVGKESVAAIQRLLHKMVVDLVRDDVKATLQRSDGNSVPTEALVQFIGGGLFGLLMWWLDSKMRMSVDDVNATLRRLALSAVKAAMRQN